MKTRNDLPFEIRKKGTSNEELASQLAQTVTLADKNILDNDFILYNTYHYGYYQPILYISIDGVRLHKIGELTTGIPGAIWDYSTFYYNGAFYFAYDYIKRDATFTNTENYLKSVNSNYFIGANVMGVAKTTDFINFEYWDIPVPSTYTQQFAPEFYEENGEVYVFFTGTNTTETLTDYNGKANYKKYCFYMKATDSSLKTFTAPVKIPLTDSKGTDVSSKIDVAINKVNNNYYLFIKYEDNLTGYIQQYKSSSLTSGYTLLNEFNKDGIAEAPAVVYFKGKYWLTADDKNLTNPYYVSTDMETWSTANALIPDDGMWLRHFTPLVINTPEQKAVIKNLVKKMGVDPVFDKSVKLDKPMTVKMRSGTINTLTLSPSCVYRYDSTSETTINAFDTSFMKKGDKCYIHPAFSNATSKLTIKYNAANKVWWNSSNDIVLSLANENYNAMYEIVCVDDYNQCFITTKIATQPIAYTTVTLSNGLVARFYKKNGIGMINLVGQPTTAIPAASNVSFTGIIPTNYRPASNETYGSYSLAVGNMCNIKAYRDGKLEINSSAGITTSQWFECSATYIVQD